MPCPHPTSAPRALLLLAATISALGTTPRVAAAQNGEWNTVHQASTWVNAFAEQPVGARTSLWFDGHWRRMNLGNEPQQLLLRPGVLFALSERVRLGAGYTYVATAPYGESPAPAPTREHRAWQHVQVGARAGETALSLRLRWEQRWLAPVSGGETQDFRYFQRARVLVRAQRPLAGWRLETGPVGLYAFNEYFLPVGHLDGDQYRIQNRASVGLALPITPTQRVDVGYMNLYNRIPQRSTRELNHTLTLGWVYTGTRP